MGLTLSLCTASAFARSKSRTPLDQSLVPLEAALQANDLDAAQLAAVSAYQQATNTLALQSSDPTVIIDPVMVAETVEFNRTKAALEIAKCFYNHAQLDPAKQWAITGTTGGTLAEEYVRRATVLLGQIATAMDRDDEAMADYLSVINLSNQYREQPAAYAGLLELLMLRKQDDLVEQWVHHGQDKFEGAGSLELDFLKAAARTLKRRNHPLWNGLDQQIVDLTPDGAEGKLPALRELASNARKFGRWAEAETNYAAICALTLKSPEETVNNHLFLAQCQAKQRKNYAACIKNLESKIQNFATTEQQDYGHYRLAKFCQDQGRDSLAQTNYWIVTSGSSTSSWAAASLRQLGALKETKGDLQGALELYLQYPKRFPQNGRFVMLAYANALEAADALGDTNISARILNTIADLAAATPDYNVHLNMAYHYKTGGRDELARKFLASGFLLARQALQVTARPQDRYLIHFRVLRRMMDFDQWQQTLDYFHTYASDFSTTDDIPDDNTYQCYWYKALALVRTGNVPAALDAFQWLADQENGRPELQAVTATTIGMVNGWQFGKTNAMPIFEAVAQKYPTHPWANLGRLQLAIQKFKAGDFPAAKKLTDDITSTLPENAKMNWIHNLYWSAVYLRGRCLQAQGDVSGGNSLKQVALGKAPHMSIQQQLNPQ